MAQHTSTKGAPDQRRDISEAEARKVAEEAREAGWERPSFAQQLYLGNFDLSLIHPHPRSSPDATGRGEEFLAQLRQVCEGIDGRAIEREDRIRDEDVEALAQIGAFGMKIPAEYGGLGLSVLSYTRALAMVSSVSPTLVALLSAITWVPVLTVFGVQASLARWRLPAAGRHHLAHDHFLDLGRIGARALDGGPDRHRPQARGGHGGQRSHEPADRRARRGQNDCIVRLFAVGRHVHLMV